MSTIALKYEILVSGIYPFNETYEKNGFVLTTNYIDENKVNTIYDMGIIYLSPYIGFCCYPNEKGKPIYLTFNKDVSLEIDYGENEEYDKEFTAEFLENKNLFDEILDLKNIMTLEINNYIKFPIILIKVFDPKGNLIMKLGEIEKINIPSLLTPDISIGNETIKRQQNRLNNNFSYKKILELKNNNKYFENALSLYFSSFSVVDENVGFTLLINALEAILAPSTYKKIESCKTCSQPKHKIRSGIAENTSLILMDENESIKKEIKKFYDKRSNFVHCGKREITKNEEQKLQEYVRKVLLIYWHTSMEKNTYEHENIIGQVLSEKYNQSIMNKTFLTMLDNKTFKENQETVSKQIFGDIIK